MLVHLIIWNLICLSIIYITGFNISVDILTGIITTFSSMWRICIHSPIISTYNQCSENEWTIVIHHYYSSLRFISLPISHKFNFIYCYGFDFDCISSIKVLCLIQFYFILIEIKIKFQYYVCRIFHLLEFECALLFILSSSKTSFFQQGKWRFFTVNTFNDGFFMNCFDNLITHDCDLSFGLMSSLDIHTPALNFRHLAGGTMPSSWWRLTHYHPRRHLAIDYELR